MRGVSVCVDGHPNMLGKFGVNQNEEQRVTTPWRQKNESAWASQLDTTTADNSYAAKRVRYGFV